MKPARLLPIGFLLIFAGFVLLVIGSLSGAGAGSASTSGFILIGPFPIFFGSGHDAGTLSWVGLAVTVVVVALYVATLLGWRLGRVGGVGAEAE